jgi:hypothetical protein
VECSTNTELLSSFAELDSWDKAFPLKPFDRLLKLFSSAEMLSTDEDIFSLNN